MSEKLVTSPDHGIPIVRSRGRSPAALANQADRARRGLGVQDLGGGSSGVGYATEPLQLFFDDIVQKMNDGLLGAALQPPSYVVADLPPASENTGGLVFVSNESGGPVPAWSDGANWKRVTDGAIVS